MRGMNEVRAIMMQPQAAFERRDHRRLGATVALVLVLHGLVAVHLSRQKSESDTATVARAMPAAIRIVTLIEAPRSSAATASIASHNKANEQYRRPSRALARANRMAGRHDAHSSRAFQPMKTEAVRKQAVEPAREALGAAQLPSAPSASSVPQASHASSLAESDAESAPLFKAAYLHNPAPDYPPIAVQRGWEGTVLLNVLVLANGGARQVDITTSSGHASLDEAAVQAVTAWRFVPAHRAGQVVDAWVHVPVVFKLE